MEDFRKILERQWYQAGCDWIVDDSIEEKVIAMYDPKMFLNYTVTTPDGIKHPKLITMFENDEVVIKIKKSES